LADDQRAVDGAQAAVSADQTQLAPYSDLSTTQAIACATLPSTTTPTTALSDCPDSPTEAQLKAKLRADEFKLQVAKDQLKKAESGG
jgi:hypothetical protein